MLSINIGASPNDRTGDPLRTAMQKIMTETNGIEKKWSGITAPVSPVPYQEWFDTTTTPPTYRLFDGTQWVASGTLDLVGHKWNVVAGTGTFSGAVTASGAIAAQGAGTGLSVTNNAAVSGALAVTGAANLTGLALTTPATYPITDVSSLGYFGLQNAYNVVSTADNGSNHTNGIHYGLALMHNVTGSGVFGPSQADGALYISLRKTNYLTSLTEGELDGVIISSMQGRKGDGGPLILSGVKVRSGTGDDTGGVLSLESTSQFINTSGVVTQDMHCALGLGEGPSGLSGGTGYGFFTDARLAQIYSAVHVDTFNQYGGGSTTYGWIYAFDATRDRLASNRYFAIRGDVLTGNQVRGDIIQGTAGNSKIIRTSSTGVLKIRNDADSSDLMSIDNAGAITIGGTLTVGGYKPGVALSTQSGGDTNNSNSGSGSDFDHNLTFSIPANFMIVGRVFKVTAHYQVTTGSAPPTLINKLKLGSTAISQHGAVTPLASQTNVSVGLSWIFQATQAPGASSNVQCVMVASPGGFTSTISENTIAMPVTIATNAAQTLKVSTQWSAVGTGTTTIGLNQLVVEALN